MTYTVKAGDTLYGISNQFGVSVTDLASLNNIKGSILQIGQLLKIPNKEGSNPNSMFMYTVKKGDTLYKIANKYNTTVKEIMDLNYLKNTNLSIGQVIRIPENYNNENEMNKPEFINYTVEKGDTLYSISKLYNVTVDEIIKDNNLTNNTLKIGQNLKIRSNNLEVLECFGDDYIPSNNTEYVVKKGDTLYKIANKYNTSVDYIKNKNNLKNNTLQVGQILYI